MKIAILTVYQIYSNKIVKDLIDKFGDDIVLIAESGVLLQNNTLLNSLKKYIKVSGLDYVLVQIIKLQLFKTISGIYTLLSNNYQNKFFSYRKLAKINRIKIQKVENVNSKNFIQLLKKNKVDIIVSVFFNQILKTPTIEVAQKGVINIHPAYLPKYKGVSPVFWSLANSEKYAGVTVHYINKGIDTGDIIEQEKVKIEKTDTEHSLYWKICEVGSPLLIRAIGKIEAGIVKAKNNRGGTYFSLPAKDAVKRYKKKRKFFNLIDYIFG